ncbi:sensor histidine kinase [Sagittula salina]|uniref:histidine kinase n=1 Tax=Sagittula salina TaxID=2820268 RepID=A0A940MRS5_9RHOB|nr:hybrid sensor histidine kinase/response regulator [Sagittula salina]MBP0483503.1 response regulator [Sagittula salina]
MLVEVPRPESTDLRVLLIEDDIGDQKMIRRAIKAAGLKCRLTVASDLASTATFAGNRFDAILLDNSLPDGHGIAAISELRSSFPEAGIVVATGQGSEELAARAIKSGADDYIPKSKVDDQSISRIIKSAVNVARLKTIAEERRKELEVFAYILSHDLKAPALHLAMLTRAAIEDIDLGPKEVLSDTLKDIETCAHRQLELLAALTAHIGMGEKTELVSVKLDEAVRTACQLVGLGTGTSPVEVMVDDLPEVRCSVAEMRQLFQNLLLNSAKFCVGRKPRIHVSGCKRDDGVVEIAVADNGIGVPEDKRDMIFQPFQRLHSRTEFEGTGLGLATCAKIVNRHGGTIWCKETPGGGLTVCFTIETLPPHE